MHHPLSIHIAILDCDTPVPNVYANRGLYSDTFIALLIGAAKNTPNLPELSLEFSKYDCVRGELPSEEELLKTTAVIVTGSSASSYDQVPWVLNLAQFTRDLYLSYPKVKIFGSCFGHQLICHALFSTPAEIVVERDPAGWELGVHPINLSPPFLSRFGPVTSNASQPSQLRLQFVHADHVVLPTLPKGFQSIGSSDHCVLQGVWQEGRVLTFQGHAEFDRFVNCETVKVFRQPAWTNEFMAKALEAVDREDDAIWAAGVILRFSLENEAEEYLEPVTEGEMAKEAMAPVWTGLRKSQSIT